MVNQLRFDVFLSHNSREKPAVEYLAEKLKRAGMEPWLDKWCLTPGGKWQQELELGLQASSSCAVFLGPEGVGSWEREELSVALDRAAKDRNFRIFSVLLPGLPDPFDDSGLPPFLKMRTWVDLRKGLDDPWSFQLLMHAIQGTTPGPVTAIQTGEDICPYRGLQTFDEEHAELFFGREREVQRLVEKLKSTRFLAVLGASGSGKSSVVRAGLLPALRKGDLDESQTWTIRVFTPGAHPLTVLTSHLSRLYPQESMQKTLDQMIEDERTFHLSVSLAMIDRPATERIVWVIDQFEEVFTACQDEKERERFFANLIYATSIPDGRNIVVLTLRADFYQKCAVYPNLSAQIAAQQFVVSPMDVDGLRRAIEEPARKVGLRFDEGLVDSILDDVLNQPGSLPLLEHALLELWLRRRGQMLTFKAYADSGGVEGAIAKRADAIFEAFTEEQRIVARQIMLRLTQPGEGTEDTRRRATISELITRMEEGAAVEKVIGILTNERLLTATDEQAYGQIISVSHEALIRGWPRLRNWVEENRAGLRIHHRLAESAQEWLRLKRDSGVLYRGARLAEVMEWREKNESSLNPLERELIDASIAIQAREEEAEKELQRRELETAQKLTQLAQAQASAERRTRLVTLGFLGITLILVAALIYYYPIRLYILSLPARGEMGKIPGGTYFLGDPQRTEENPNWYLSPKEYSVEAFSIDLSPVTFERYLLCMEAARCGSPSLDPKDYEGVENANKPVVGVNAYQAAEFCGWIGRRLPTDKEWELAARQKIFKESGGIYEWTSSPYDQSAPEWEDISLTAPDALTQKGDVFDEPLTSIMTFRQSALPTNSNNATGFRCAANS
jgi:formylglycine-generating enzyme required for sulfatase activity